MTLADRLSDGPNTGPEDLGGYEYNIGTGVGEFNDIPSDKPLEDAEDWAPIFKRFHLSPDRFEIVDDTVNCSMWQQSKRTENGDRDVVDLYSYRAVFRKKRGKTDLPALYAEARRKPRAKVKYTPAPRTSVPVLADPQIGKTGSRGGTAELLDRLEATRERLADELKRRKPEDIVFPDINDLFENFNSGGNPMFTNDLSLAQQMDLAGTEVYKFVELFCRFGPTRVRPVPSNHTGWRHGSQYLGTPGDDLGIFVHKQVEKVAKAAGLPAEWAYPERHDESTVVDVRGTKVGIAHGNQFRPGKGAEWWAKQTHGGQPVGLADVLLTGHYHHLSILPTGRSPFTGRSKWWIQAPTLDNGSDWFRNIAGDDSDPGMLLFDITDDGFDLQSLTVL